MKEKYPVIFNSWYYFLKDILETSYFEKLMKFLNISFLKKSIFPSKKNVFKCFRLTDYNKLKVIILGQDPYFDGSATGLAFANADHVLIESPSLKKIVEVLERDYDMMLSYDITLESWAKQGILLLNTALTVKKYEPNSHSKPWFRFTEYIIKKLNQEKTGLIFCLWGKHAQSYKNLIDEKKHYILEAEHPAFAARQNRTWNCNHFTEINKIINKQNGKKYEIKW